MIYFYSAFSVDRTTAINSSVISEVHVISIQSSTFINKNTTTFFRIAFS